MDPRLSELLAEVDDALTAVVDDLIPALVTQPVNMERVGAARDRIAKDRDAVREMIEQETGDAND